ncbi:hypothetical protein ACFWPP_38180 [Streptomyces anulatus]|uniref:hypothetical protein n=1 Tax=Streptomyces anulatus TaxID=1892 RepID=UPI0036660434
MGHGRALLGFGSAPLAMTAAPHHAAAPLAMTAAPHHASSPLVRLFVSILLTASQVGRVHWT